MSATNAARRKTDAKARSLAGSRNKGNAADVLGIRWRLDTMSEEARHHRVSEARLRELLYEAARVTLDTVVTVLELSE